jgi:hypothetical protein
LHEILQPVVTLLCRDDLHLVLQALTQISHPMSVQTQILGDSSPCSHTLKKWTVTRESLHSLIGEPQALFQMSMSRCIVTENCVLVLVSHQSADFGDEAAHFVAFEAPFVD